MKKYIESHKIFLFIFLFTLFIFFKDVITLKVGFVKGDYLSQFLPWFDIYAHNLKEFRLPMWTRYIQCGFPLFAEGQTGMLYPLNVLFFGLLPFKAAYNYSVIAHFMLAGVFTYVYTRKLGADVWGGTISAFLFCFGGVYAGCFINTNTLKALAWFPLILFMFESYLETENIAWIIFSGLVCGMQLLAGSFQMATYSIFFYVFYFVIRAYSDKKLLIILRDLCLFMFVLSIVASPQIFATWQLSQHSGRSIQSLGFALWNSFSPLSLIGLIFPHAGAVFSRNIVIYVSILGLFFAITGIKMSASDKRIRTIALLAALFLFLALGKYNPVYIWLLKSLKVYFFRAPSRFIFFTTFGLAVLSGVGFSKFFNSWYGISKSGTTENRTSELSPKAIFLRTENIHVKSMKIFAVLLIAATGALFLFKMLWRFFGSMILNFAKAYVTSHIYGKAHHRYSLDFYIKKTENIYHLITQRTLFTDVSVCIALIMIILALSFLFFMIRKPNNSTAIKLFCTIFIFTDIYIFGYYTKGFRSDLADMNYSVSKGRKIFEALKADTSVFRVYPYGLSKLPDWIKPNTNMYYKIDSIGAYSPLVDNEYYMNMEELGVVDDSLGLMPPKAGALSRNSNWLRWLNVKYVISGSKLKEKNLKFIKEDEGICLYSLKGFYPRIFFSDSLMPDESRGIRDIKSAVVAIEKYNSGYARCEIENSRKGFLIFSEKYAPEWQASIDGKKEKIQNVRGLLQAVKLLPGRHKVVFIYRPLSLYILIGVSAISFISFLCLGLNLIRRSKVYYGRKAGRP